MPPTTERRTITIPAGTMINRGPHEDDEPNILTQPTDAFVAGEPTNHALPVIIPSIEQDVIFYIHQPEKKRAG